MRTNPILLFVAALLIPLGAVGTALYTQHVLGMMPCPWCVLQRLIFLAISLLALPGLLRVTVLRRLSAVLVLVLALCGVAAALWQHFVAASSNSCVQTLADRIVQGLGLSDALPEVFAAYASCADAKIKLFGVPYEFYSLGLFVLLAGLMVAALRSTARPSGW